MTMSERNASMCKVAHLTSVHRRNDTRIFLKQCRTLAAHGYDVTLVVADDAGDESNDGVAIADVGRRPGRLNRMLHTTRRVFDKAVALDADIYHLHDPELIPAGLKLKRMGKKVIFDSHEDVASQLLGKPYLGPLSRQGLSAAFSLFERYACSRFDGIVTATPFIRDKFLRINPSTVDVNNYPLPGEFDAGGRWADKEPEVCYVGGIEAMRGIRELVRACALLRSPARLTLAGRFSDPALEAEVSAYPGWQRVVAHGQLDRAGVRRVLARAVAGLVTLHPVANYLDALPVKMFEYMASGIPVIASRFPLFRGIVEGGRCGLCVDPHDPVEIAAAIDYLVANPGIAKTMGANGRKAVLEQYNWPAQAIKLTDFYGAISHAKQIVAPC
ncbi:MAG: glycosyl transferase [Massilia sp.]|jgi:glycosyltransferase involved in cell wall biosynthesis|nr:glycosyl transferase [Massilia sp.]